MEACIIVDVDSTKSTKGCLVSIAFHEIFVEDRQPLEEVVKLFLRRQERRSKVERIWLLPESTASNHTLYDFLESVATLSYYQNEQSKKVYNASSLQ